MEEMGVAAVNDMDLEAIGKQNKLIRGYIIRSLVKGPQNRLPVKQLSNVLLQVNLIISPDISKYLDYLHGAGYIEFMPEKITAYTAYSKDAIVKLTNKGIDLVEQTIDDAGVAV